MNDYKVIAISTRLADRVRASRRSPGYGHPAHEELATGYGPCRHCLRTFEAGAENRILFTLDPFHEIEKFPLPGPVFIHVWPCARYDEGGGIPAGLLSHALTVHAFGVERQLLREERLEGAGLESVAKALLRRDDVRYLHVRDTDAGCYDFRIERAEELQDAR